MAKKRKKTIKEPIPESNISLVAKALKGVLGSDAVHNASESDQGEPRIFIPSGVPDLDYVLDRKSRGWPGGRIVEVFGGEATCKTGLGYALVASAQRMGGDAILYPTEGNWDEWLADRYGIDLSRLVIGDDETVEGVFGSFLPALKSIGKHDLLVGMIDSIAGLESKAELLEEELKRGRQAQIRAMLISIALRKLGAEIPRHNAILFCVNQIRDNPDATYGEKTKPVGGRALRFYASIRLKIEILGKWKRQRAGKKYVAGFKLKITAVKNRLARPYQEAEVWLSFEKGLLPKGGEKTERKNRK